LKNIINDNVIQPTYFIDFDNKAIQDFIKENTNKNQSDKEKVISLYYAVRDKIKYDPYHIILKKEKVRSSEVLNRQFGYCVEKALLLVSCVRGAGIPAKIGFANVKNHLTSPRLFDLMKTDIFVFHGYADILLDGKWVKATPAFNKSLCEKTNTIPLEFDGESNSIFHSLDLEGRKHMEYLEDFGSYEDLPFERMISEYNLYYPHLKIHSTGTFGPIKIKANFEEEAKSHL
jgi:transglutaminase-like putative cysteine protease